MRVRPGPAARDRRRARRRGVGTQGGTSRDWRKYLNGIRDPDNKDLRRYFGRYICREWNARHTDAEELVDLQIVYMKVKTLSDYRRTTPEKVILWEHSCSWFGIIGFEMLVLFASMLPTLLLG